MVGIEFFMKYPKIKPLGSHLTQNSQVQIFTCIFIYIIIYHNSRNYESFQQIITIHNTFKNRYENQKLIYYFYFIFPRQHNNVYEMNIVSCSFHLQIALSISRHV